MKRLQFDFEVEIRRLRRIILLFCVICTMLILPVLFLLTVVVNAIQITVPARGNEVSDGGGWVIVSLLKRSTRLSC